MFKKSFLILFSFLLVHGLRSQTYGLQKEIPLWQEVPNSINNEDYVEAFRYDKSGNINALKKVKNPTLKLFLVNNKKTDNTAVVICPGGGYSVLSHIKEGDKVAAWFNSIGISAIVLKYRLPSDAIMEDKSIAPLQDAQEAIRTIRRNALMWNIDPTKIGVIGFSAGGHLASTLSTQFDREVYESDTTSARPDFSILIYPVISMEDGTTHQGSKINLLGEHTSSDLVARYSSEKQVDKTTPPALLIHSTDDTSVPVENSINYYLALKKNKVPTELHMYEDGGHGYGLGRSGTHTQWPDACKNWLLKHLFISEN